MKRFLSTTAFVVSLAMLFILSPTQSHTAENTASNEPIKVLGVKINPTSLQTTWIDGLELEIENTSRKSIGYLLLHVDLRGTNVRVPVTFGKLPGEKTGTSDSLAPGAKITLKAAKAVCDRMKEQARNRIPMAGDLQTNINVVVFSDRSAWKGGYMNYPDPTNSSRWLATEDTTTVNFIKANFKPNSKTNDCFRYGGFTLQYCCDSNYVASANFISDPNGSSQPQEAEACCYPGNCCSYTDIAPCS
jgi:hypothetical protein